MKTPIRILSLLILFIFLTACNREEVNARKSLEGRWEVAAVKSIYGVFEIQNGSIVSADNSSTVDESSGNYGSFEFAASDINYQFERNDTIYSDSGAWQLKLEAVKVSGFNTNKYYLEIDQEEIFELQFGDQSKNAEKNATEIRLIQEPKQSGTGVIVELLLLK